MLGKNKLLILAILTVFFSLLMTTGGVLMIVFGAKATAVKLVLLVVFGSVTTLLGLCLIVVAIVMLFTSISMLKAMKDLKKSN